MKNCFLTILSIYLSLQTIDCQQISEWRPENRTGVSAETGLMKSWPATGSTLLWSNLDLAKGYSSPSFGASTIIYYGILYIRLTNSFDGLQY
jgi:hypothetical protein